MTATVDGLLADEAARIACAPQAWVRASVGSTMDDAHQLAASGAPSGTIVVADVQDAGRGQLGRKWVSAAGQGLWMTTIHRGVDVRALDWLAIRVGLELARALDPLAEAPIRIKWPNDLLVESGKLGGILVEARWRDQALEWIGVGVGINLRVPPGVPRAAALRGGASRRDALAAAAPAIRAACEAGGELTAGELQEFAMRDAARDARILQPAIGYARGISATGALLVDTPAGRAAYRRGSLVFESEAE